MTAALKVSNQTIAAEEIIPLLVRYKMLPQLLQENIIDRAITPFTCTSEETASACQQFYEQNQLTLKTKRQAWLERYDTTLEQLEAQALRELRVEKFKQATWAHKLESYFLKRKEQLDKAIYSLIRTKDRELAQELYFRIQEGEQPFAELARKYSQDPEAQTGGIVGPVALSSVPPTLARLLLVSQPGQLCPLFSRGEWVLIVRLEKLIPAALDETMRQRLLNELFEAWLQEQLSQILDSDRICLGTATNRDVDTIAHLAAI